MNSNPKISVIKVLAGKHLEVTFSNGKIKVYNCNPLLQREEFALLRSDGFFNSVKIDSGGYGISWNDKLDLSEYELWENGVEKEIEAGSEV